VGQPRRTAVAGAIERWLAEYLAPADPVIVACSGGADSLALAVGAREALAASYQLVGATVDHQLQAGSAERATGTADLLRGLGYPRVEVLTVQVSGEGGPEAAARRARYTALRRLSEQVGTTARPSAVLLAHTADDQAETVLLGLARGSGPRSIAGMQPWRPPWGRPLLGLRRVDTEQACRDAGLLPWRDPHNIDPAFTRVRLRVEVLPLLDEVLGGGVRPALARTAQLMAQDLQALDDIAAAVLDRVGRSDGSLDAVSLSTEPAAVVGRVLRSWAAAAGAGPLSYDHLQRMVAQVKGRPGPAQVRLPGGFDVLLDSDVVLRMRPVGGRA
jgi:tRNA(Ile)-lysidine synthase